MATWLERSSVGEGCDDYLCRGNDGRERKNLLIVRRNPCEGRGYTYSADVVVARLIITGPEAVFHERTGESMLSKPGPNSCAVE